MYLQVLPVPVHHTCSRAHINPSFSTRAGPLPCFAAARYPPHARSASHTTCSILTQLRSRHPCTACHTRAANITA